MIKPGSLVKMTKVTPEYSILARDQPTILGALRNAASLGEIPDGSIGMVISWKQDKLREVLNFSRGAGTNRYTSVSYYLVMWEGQNVWVSTLDAHFEEVK